MRKFLFLAILFTLLGKLVSGQLDLNKGFSSPLDIPLLLSGNYGELRVGHFHAGIDIKTMGEIGKPVYAAADGYVSRIKVQSGGYGKSVYITHPNGYTTVYGHLNNYIPEIDEYVKKSQYVNQSYEVDLFPAKDWFVFTSHQPIAISGNTGSSGGPHLHFEIRKTEGGVPLNGLRFGLPIEDNLKPRFKTLFVYSLPEAKSIGNNSESRSEYAVKKINDSIFSINSIVEINDNYVGFGTEVYDYLNGTTNRCGIYSLELYIDNSPVYSFTIDEISFDQTAYINAHMDFELKIHASRSVHRLFSLPNNKLPIYKSRTNKGIYKILNDSLHTAEIKAFDINGNHASLFYSFREQGKSNMHIFHQPSGELINWNEDKTIQYNNLKVTIPSGALYRDIYLDVRSAKGAKVDLSDTLFIHYDSEPLLKNITLQLSLDSIDESLRSKILFARVDGENNTNSSGGEWFDGKITATTKNFGKYIIMVDTIAPEIVPSGFINNKTYAADSQLVFTVEDKLSGLKSYNAYIDDKWALMEYDSKTNSITYAIDSKRITKGGMHKISIYAVDERNNISVYNGQFKY